MVEGPIPFTALCEHHALPFFGRAFVGYIAHENIIGISKLTRLVRIATRRFGVQERMTHQIAEALVELTEPHGVAVYMDAHHLCTQMRGVREVNPMTRTTAFRGRVRNQCGAALGVLRSGRTAARRSRLTDLPGEVAWRWPAEARDWRSSRSGRRRSRCQLDGIEAAAGCCRRPWPTAIQASWRSRSCAERPTVIANFVSSVDGVVALGPSEPAAGGGEISGFSEADRYMMALLRGLADVVIVGAGTVRVGTPARWTAAPPRSRPWRRAFAAWRAELWLSAQPTTIVVTASGNLDPAHPGLCAPDVPVIVATTPAGAERLELAAAPGQHEGRGGRRRRIGSRPGRSSSSSGQPAPAWHSARAGRISLASCCGRA